MFSSLEPGEYDALVVKAKRNDASSSAELLQFMRTHKIHQPELAVLHGGRLLKNNPRSLGSEVWTVMEQVFLAAAELGHAEWREYCLTQLTKQFPSSVRVERLKGIQKESNGDWSEAKKIYEKILTDKPEDTTTRKRLIAVTKQSGKTAEAIEQINTYLDTFSTDTEVWHELGELYIESGALSRAVFCFEELIVANPRSMYHILTYAELLFSTGDMELSRKYFSLAAYLDGSSLRALWGLLSCNMALAEKDKSDKKMEELQKFTLERLRNAYRNVGSHGKPAMALLSHAQPLSS
jgi:tetratricopeptide (TPR) repeat protein